MNRRQLLFSALLISTSLIGSFDLGVNAAMPGMAGDIQRSYSNTRFGRVHHWSIGQGSTLLMLHQSGQASTEFLAIAPLLADSFTVVGIDLPNHGQSDTSDHELTVDEYADAVIDVLDNMGITQAHMLGQHGGAVVVINLGIRYPERVGKVILSGAGHDENVSEEELQKKLNTPMTRDLPIDVDGDFLQKTWSVYRKMSASNTPPEVTFQPFLSSLTLRQRRYDLHYAVYRYSPNLDEFNKETLLLKAEEDIYAGDVAALQRRIPGSIVRKIPDCGAWQFFEQPELHKQIIEEFLD
ncbi:MAG: alpha/beta hydrolase [Candidatus Poseidoniia archaeon]|nr:alpha/beta hydrolase [Candidatus Poseidoniia archaeon]